MEAHKILFRASAMGKIMTGKNKPVDESETTKKQLVKMMREYKYNRMPSFSNKYTKKGNICENDSIDLYCIHKGKFYKKNETRLNNTYFTGECDLFDGDSFEKAEEIVDIKSSWSMDTFPSFVDLAKKDYIDQGNVYMDLSGAQRHTIAHCLVNTPATMIMDAKYYAKKEFGVIDLETPEYIEHCKKIEVESIFDIKKFIDENPWFELHNNVDEWIYDMPIESRIIEVTIERDDVLIMEMKARVMQCRDWMNANWNKV